MQSDQPAGSFNVVGRVVDADTGEPIEFAFVTMLKPGTDLGPGSTTPTRHRSPPRRSPTRTASTPPSRRWRRPIYPFLIQVFGYQSIGGNLNLSEGGFLPDIALTSLE